MRITTEEVAKAIVWRRRVHPGLMKKDNMLYSLLVKKVLSSANFEEEGSVETTEVKTVRRHPALNKKSEVRNKIERD